MVAPKHTPEESAIALVVDRLHNALETHPSWNSSHEGYAVILEELDELWLEVKRKQHDRMTWRMVSEAVDIAAAALRFMIDLYPDQTQLSADDNFGWNDGD